MEEIWKEIQGFEGLYQVSNFGRIYSCRFKKIKKLINNGRYFQTTLSKNGIKIEPCVHILVAEAFIPNPNNLPEVNHKDENGFNNNVDNLEWCTHQYNCNYGTRNKRISNAQKNDPKRSKQVAQYSIDGNLVKVWQSLIEINRQLGYSHGNIGQCCNGKRKTAYSFLWKYL